MATAEMQYNSQLNVVYHLQKIKIRGQAIRSNKILSIVRLNGLYKIMAQCQTFRITEDIQQPFLTFFKFSSVTSIICC